MPSYKLHYFNARGAAETARVLFALADQAYEDVRHAGEEWQAFKPSTPNGQLPVLEVDGKMYSQSNAINLYLAEAFDFNGKNSTDRLLINGVIGDKDDVSKKYPFSVTDEVEKKKAIENFIKEQVPNFFGKVEKSMTERCATNYYLGSDVGLSLADIVIHQIYEFISARNTAGNDLLADFPKSKSVYNTVGNEPRIKKWIDTRPKTDF